MTWKLIFQGWRWHSHRVPDSLKHRALLLLANFCACACGIARRDPNKHFVNCLFGLNKVWITSAHILLFDQHVARHVQEVAMMKSMPLPDSPRAMMALMGPLSVLSRA